VHAAVDAYSSGVFQSCMHTFFLLAKADVISCTFLDTDEPDLEFCFASPDADNYSIIHRNTYITYNIMIVDIVKLLPNSLARDHIIVT